MVDGSIPEPASLPPSPSPYSRSTSKPVDGKPASGNTRLATFGAGCFWGVELAFSQLKGVVSTRVGYSGGDEASYPAPTYRQVCHGHTRHAEVVRVEYDPAVISYDELLRTFWSCHDPTQLNRQGPDLGPQYRSAILYHDDGQREAALASLEREQERLGPGRRIVTELVQAGPFHTAEEYHQGYLKKRGLAACHI